MSIKTTDKNLETRFEAGEDVLDYFDLSKARRPLLKKDRVNVDLPRWMIVQIDRAARRKGIPRQAQIKEWLAGRIKEEAA